MFGEMPHDFLKFFMAWCLKKNTTWPKKNWNVLAQRDGNTTFTKISETSRCA